MNGKVVVVAVKASKEIPKCGLVWALTHIVQPGDRIKLLVVTPHQSSGKKVWNFARMTGDCAHGHRRFLSGTLLDQRDDISDSCSELLLNLQGLYDPEKVKMRVKVVMESPTGVVATEARKVQANWVILDKHLRQEKKYCLNGLVCNLVVMRRSEPKVLRLNLIESLRIETELPWSSSFPVEEDKVFEKTYDECNTLKGPSVTPVSSPEHDSMLTTTYIGTASISSSDLWTSPFSLPETSSNQNKRNSFISVENQSVMESDSDMDIEKLVTPSTILYFQPWLDDVLCTSGELSKYMVAAVQKHGDDSPTSTYRSMLEDLSKIDEESDAGVLNHRFELNLSKSVRDAISLSANAPLEPPPLCSLCRHKTPEFGNPPKWFTYAELELATNSFADENFLAEGGFGSVYRGTLPDGQVVAVKQHKMASSQGDQEFCSEVEVLSCAQHRNVVRLIGFCVEDGRRLLVYEYICNGSLDSHLFGCDHKPLTWSARQKIAVGAARGLRYLHEECRVGCIVHRDMRPNNILITHDFEPLVGDFGLARWQPNGDLGVNTRIIGTFGYLAPEYAQSGQITEKADVYSFGVVLVELITGRKAVDINRPKGQQCLTEWARPLLENQSIDELIDPRLSNCYHDQALHRMLRCASLCIHRDPYTRPRMSQVLRMLEGEVILNLNTSL